MSSTPRVLGASYGILKVFFAKPHASFRRLENRLVQSSIDGPAGPQQGETQWEQEQEGNGQEKSARTSDWPSPGAVSFSDLTKAQEKAVFSCSRVASR
jgi:hypothetical protein